MHFLNIFFFRHILYSGHYADLFSQHFDDLLFKIFNWLINNNNNNMSSNNNLYYKVQQFWNYKNQE